MGGEKVDFSHGKSDNSINSINEKEGMDRVDGKEGAEEFDTLTTTTTTTMACVQRDRRDNSDLINSVHSINEKERDRVDGKEGVEEGVEEGMDRVDGKKEGVKEGVESNSMNDSNLIDVLDTTEEGLENIEEGVEERRQATTTTKINTDVGYKNRKRQAQCHLSCHFYRLTATITLIVIITHIIIVITVIVIIILIVLFFIAIFKNLFLLTSFTEINLGKELIKKLILQCGNFPEAQVLSLLVALDDPKSNPLLKEFFHCHRRNEESTMFLI